MAFCLELLQLPVCGAVSPFLELGHSLAHHEMYIQGRGIESRVDVTRTNNDNGDRRISASASDFSSIFPWVKIPGRADLTPSAQVTAGKTVHSDGSITAGMSFRIDEGGPDFYETQQIFERNFSFIMPLPSPHGSPPPAGSPWKPTLEMPFS